jgi:hypothetical protein
MRGFMYCKNHEISMALKVGKFVYFLIRADQILHLLQKLHGKCIEVEVFVLFKFVNSRK